MPEAKPPRNASPWIKAFVAFHVICITMWSLPYPKKPYMNGTAKIGINTSSVGAFSRSFSESVTEGILYWNWKYLKNGPILYYPGVTGYWQYWDMFSPNPASVDLFMDAEVKFKNGDVQVFDYPRIYKLSIPQKYLKERYRKFFENVNQDTQGFIRPAVSQRIALESFKDPNNPPVEVTLIRHFDTIERPGAAWDPNYTVVRFFTYQVDQKKLMRDKGIKP